MSDTDNRRKFIINFSYVAIIILIVYLTLKYLLGIVMPFLIGFAVAALLNMPVRYLCKRNRLSKRFTAISAVVLFYGTVGVLLSFFSVKLFVAAGNLFGYLPDFYNDTVAPLLSHFFDFIENLLAKFDGSAVSIYGSVFSDVEISLGSAISALSMQVLGYISSVASNLPIFVAEVLLTVISTFFFAADYGYITGFLLSLLPEKSQKRLCETKKCLFGVIFKYVKSYSFIMLITFGELALGLTICRVENPFFIALIISVLDVMPVIGTGLVMIPWGVIELLDSNYRLGIGLLAVYGVITVVRNIIEPKIVGKEVGLHPALTLISMFVGTRLFGLVGLIALPVTLSVLKSLDECGQIRIFRKSG